jgi:cytidine deaminase
MSQPDQSVVSVLALDVSVGRERELFALTGQIQALIHRKAYGSCQLLRDSSRQRRYYDIRLWRNAETAARAQTDVELEDLWQRLSKYLLSTPLVDLAWAVETGLAAAGPWPDRRARAERREGAERRTHNRGYPGGERRGKFDRRLGPRRAEEHGGLSLLAAARTAWEHAHAPFSGLKVGAALETADGHIVTGCNVENVTYGLTICAERVAMFKAISEGHRMFTRIAIVAQTPRPAPPCGACRQILWELGGDIEVVLADLAEVRRRHHLKDLLPLPFDAEVFNEDRG